MAPSSEDHSFKPAGPNDSRSPCPALNVLANHGYLPRDGKRISMPTFIRVLMSQYNLSFPLACSAALPALPLCCRRWDLTLDLHDLARAGRIEHKASLAHADANPGEEYAPITPNAELLANLLADAKSTESMPLEGLIRARARRDATLDKPFGVFYGNISRGECALIWSVLGRSQKIPLDWLKQWIGEERLPDGWRKADKTVSIIHVAKVANEVKAGIAKENAEKTK